MEWDGWGRRRGNPDRRRKPWPRWGRPKRSAAPRHRGPQQSRRGPAPWHRAVWYHTGKTARSGRTPAGSRSSQPRCTGSPDPCRSPARPAGSASRPRTQRTGTRTERAWSRLVIMAFCSSASESNVSRGVPRSYTRRRAVAATVAPQRDPEGPSPSVVLREARPGEGVPRGRSRRAVPRRPSPRRTAPRSGRARPTRRPAGSPVPSTCRLNVGGSGPRGGLRLDASGGGGRGERDGHGAGGAARGPAGASPAAEASVPGANRWRGPPVTPSTPCLPPNRGNSIGAERRPPPSRLYVRVAAECRCRRSPSWISPCQPFPGGARRDRARYADVPRPAPNGAGALRWWRCRRGRRFP